MIALPKLLQLLGFCAALAGSEAPSPVTEGQFAEKLRNYKTIAHLKTKFRQTKSFRNIDMTIKSEGTLELSPPGGVIWKILKPSYVMVSMNKDQFTMGAGQGSEYSEQTIRLSEVNSSQKKSLAGLVAWLEMNPEKLYAQYEISKTAENSFLFFPKDKKENPFKSLTMTLDNKGNLKQLLIDEVSGDKLKMDFDPPEIVRVK